MVFSAGIQRLVFSELTVKSRVRVTAGAVDSRRRLNYRVHRHRWQSGSGRSYTPWTGGFAVSGRWPLQTNTGRRGYFTNRESSNESLHITKVEPRSDSIRRACWQSRQRPGSGRVGVLSITGMHSHCTCNPRMS